MEKVKFYYSTPVHIRTINIFTDAEGNPMYIPDCKPLNVKPVPRITVATIWNTEDNTMRFGVSVCSPKDTFKKEIGRDLAYNRAKDSAEISIKLTKRNKIRDISKRYANELISQYLKKYVCFNL